MAFNKVRGQQIKNGSISGEHLAKSAIQAVLSNKLIVDYVQIAQPITVPESSSSVTVQISGTPVEVDNTTDLGILLGKKVIIRNTETGEPIYNPDHKHEVFGKLTHSEDTGYTLSFGCYEIDGSFTTYEFSKETQIDIQYAQRFTLATVDEMFASNEKFVDGAIDVTTAIKIKEIQEKLDKLAGDSTEGIDEVKKALQDQIDAIKEVIGKDAIEESYQLTEDETYDSSKTYYKKEVESYVQIAGESEFIAGEVYEKIPAQDPTGIKGILKEYEDRISDLENTDNEIAKKLESYKKYIVQIDESASKSEVLLPNEMRFKKLEGNNGLYEDNLYVYINGLLQAEDINFNQIEDDNNPNLCKGVSFTDDQLMEGDVVIIKWINETIEAPSK